MGLLIVTPEQKTAGYFERRGGITVRRDFEVGWQMEDGNYVVRPPDETERDRTEGNGNG